jgi:hypothetical protein
MIKQFLKDLAEHGKLYLKGGSEVYLDESNLNFPIRIKSKGEESTFTICYRYIKGYTTVKPEREVGYYWCKDLPTNEWNIFYWNSEEFCLGRCMYREEDFEVDERKIVRN